MPYLTLVEVWPSTGYPRGQWLEEPTADAFVKSARRVRESYSEALRAAEIANRVSTVRLMPIAPDPRRSGRGAPGGIEVVALTDRLEGREGGRVHLPAGLERLTAEQRGRIAFDVIDSVMRRLAQTRGWDITKLDEVAQQVIDQGLDFVWTGPWKLNRSRRHRARCRFELADDGFGRMRIQIAAARDERVLFQSEEYTAFSTLEGFKRATRTMRWLDESSVQVTPMVGLLRMTGRTVSWSFNPAAEPQPAATLAPTARLVEAPLKVVVRAEGADAPDMPKEIFPGGGGPMNRVPAAYSKVLDELWEEIRGEVWQDWWRAGPPGPARLRLGYNFGEVKPGPRIRVYRNVASASINRPTNTILRGTQAAAQAFTDAHELLEKISARFDLGPLPAFSITPPQP